MSEITWEDPPSGARGAGRKPGPNPIWPDRVAPLFDHPGRWANLGSHHTSTPTRIKTGRVPGIKPGDFDAVMRGISNGRGTLYVRYVGGDSA